MRNEKKTILLGLDLNGGTNRDILTGILKFAQRRPFWMFKLVSNENMLIHELSSGKNFDGVINTSCIKGNIRNPTFQTFLHRWRDIPVVTYCLPLPRQPYRNIPNKIYIADDDISIAQIAYNYIRSLGRFRSYAYVHPIASAARWSDERAKEFTRLLRKDGQVPYVYGPLNTESKSGEKEEQLDLGKFLLNLPKPAVVFCAFDKCAQQAIIEAQHCHIAIPREISVIGVDNDEIICESTRPRITSVRANHVKFGLVMAQELDRLMTSSKQVKNPKLIRIPAIDVIVRETSAPTAPAATYLIQRALDYISKNAFGHLRVEDVARHLGVSRRLLEYRFAQYESKSLASTIRAAWLDRAKKLLSQTSINIIEIAQQIGFANPKSFHAIFTRETGTPPGAWRKKAKSSKEAKSLQMSGEGGAKKGLKVPRVV